MADKLANYKGSIEIAAGLRPKNNGEFPLMEAHDVVVDNNDTRLDDFLIKTSTDATDAKELANKTATTINNINTQVTDVTKTVTEVNARVENLDDISKIMVISKDKPDHECIWVQPK